MKTKYYALSLAAVFLLFACKKQADKMTQKEEVAQPSERILFDGKTFEGWRLYGGGQAGEAWKIEDESLVFYPPAERPEGKNYNLITEEQFTNFELSLEWKIAQAGNSGIFWGILESDEYGQPYQTGPEIQVLDNQRHPDAQNGPDRTAGALYDMVPPSSDQTKPAGEWNECILHVNHDTGKGWVKMNGTLIVEFPVQGAGWDALVKDSKFADWQGFGAYPKGHLGLQDHGDTVAFRNIKIKEL